jgi:hypothetical protein
MMMGNQVISTPRLKVKSFRMNIYQNMNELTKLIETPKITTNFQGVSILVLDSVKLAMYLLYFGLGNIIQAYSLLTDKDRAIT